jgi:hypothetical protein
MKIKPGPEEAAVRLVWRWLMLLAEMLVPANFPELSNNQ